MRFFNTKTCLAAMLGSFSKRAGGKTYTKHKKRLPPNAFNEKVENGRFYYRCKKVFFFPAHFHISMNKTLRTCGSKSSTSNQCAWWGVHSLPGQAWCRILASHYQTHSLPPYFPRLSHGDGSDWYGLFQNSGAALWIISFCCAKTRRWEWNDYFFFPSYFLSHTQQRANILSCALFFCFPGKKEFIDSMSAPHRLFRIPRSNFNSHWLAKLCVYVLNKKQRKNPILGFLLLLLVRTQISSWEVKTGWRIERAWSTK